MLCGGAGTVGGIAALALDCGGGRRLGRASLGMSELVAKGMYLLHGTRTDATTS